MWEIFTQSRQYQQQLDARWHRLYRLVYSWCHDPHLASDLSQEAIVKALKNRHQLKDENSLDAWLFTILNNCWKDHWRKNREMVDIETIEIPIEDNQTSSFDQQELVNGVRRAIAQLPVNQRQIISLIDIEEMSYKEVANILDIPIGTVMSRLCRARNALKTILQDIDQEKPGLRRIK